MLKKKKLWDKQLYLKYFYFKNKNISTIKKSFKKNHYLEPHKRAFYFLNKYTKYLKWNYYNSKQKLYCLKTTKKNVPSKKLLLSRYTLISALETLKINNIKK